MNLIVWLALGALLGWVASILARARAQQGVALNVAVGIAGAVLGGWLLFPVFAGDSADRGGLDLASSLAALVAGVLLLAVVNLFNRGTSR